VVAEQFLTPSGKLGVLLFLVGPIASGFFYSEMRVDGVSYYDSRNASTFALLMALSAFASLVGCVLVLVGRSYRLRREAEPDQGSQPHRSSPAGSRAIVRPITVHGKHGYLLADDTVEIRTADGPRNFRNIEEARRLLWPENQ